MTQWQQGGTPRGGSNECPPTTPDPAEQPGAHGEDCGSWPTATPPERKKPDDCPKPDPSCKCPPPPSTDANCLEKLIAKQAEQITLADKAKSFKADLEAFLGKARTASQEYNRDKYKGLLAEWEKQDREICDLIRKLDCAVPCWPCIFECHICPIINDIHNNELWLYGDGSICTSDKSLYDVRYWHERDLEAKRRRFDRIKAVLAMWEKPAQTIEKALADDAKLIADAGKSLGTEPGKLVYDVFLRLVPMHLAIAPPAAVKKTCISKRYTEFCKCDAGKPDWCCGLDLGETSVRQRLIGPMPYLIDPNDYFKLICCLVENRYGKAKDELAKAEAAFQARDDEIKRVKAQIDEAIKSFEKNAKGAIPGTIDCCDYDPAATTPPASSAR